MDWAGVSPVVPPSWQVADQSCVYKPEILRLPLQADGGPVDWVLTRLNPGDAALGVDGTSHNYSKSAAPTESAT